MNGYFDTLYEDYQNAEISCVVLHNRKTNEWLNLLTIIELIPEEQEASPLIGKAEHGYCDRETVDSIYAVYVARRIHCPIPEAITIFKEPEKGILLLHEQELNCRINIFTDSILEQEPSSEYPLLINKHTDNAIGPILPARHTDLRVWTKIDREKRWVEQFTEKQRERIFMKAGALTKKHLGFDIEKMWEHASNIYLCGCNPYLRSYSSSLLDQNQDLVITFRERAGKTIIGKKIVLEDKRADNLSFSIERTINSIRERVELPHFPDMFQLRLYDNNGFLLENHSGAWANFAFNMQIQTAQLNLNVNRGGKKEVIKIPKYASERPSTVGTYDHSLSRFLKGKQQLRELALLEDSGDFIFLSGENKEKDREQAREAVSKHLNKASKVCMMLDPYFGAGDLFYVYLIRNASIPVQIITSAAFLKKNAIGPKGGKMRQGILLDRALKKFRRAVPFQNVEIKVLPGKDSPLHDRYLVVDDTVYLLGSSLNEFGSRATTLIKVPHPLPMIEKAKQWWGDASKATPLADFLRDLNTKK